MHNRCVFRQNWFICLFSLLFFALFIHLIDPRGCKSRHNSNWDCRNNIFRWKAFHYIHSRHCNDSSHDTNDHRNRLIADLLARLSPDSNQITNDHNRQHRYITWNIHLFSANILLYYFYVTSVQIDNKTICYWDIFLCNRRKYIWRSFRTTI